MKTIDLRSDTVTVPTPSMRKAMAEAEVGDDVYGEDPTINRLQAMSAERLGKEAGLFVASGTMGNLVAVLAHCNRGDEVIMGDKAHTFLFEGGGVSALGGISMHTLPNQVDGTLALDAIQGAIRAKGNPHFPLSRLVILENTHNRCGGVPITLEYEKRVSQIARQNDMAMHLDGARLFNASAVLGISAAELSEPFDSVTFCLSKGLCAPVGSVVCGSKEFIQKALRVRKQVGGGMRQAGILAAAGIVALQEMTERLSEDHVRALALANGLQQIKGLQLYLQPPIMTNMVFIALDEDVPWNASQVLKRLGEYGIRVGVSGPRHFRMVTHYWITDEDIDQTIKAFSKVL